jgi:hypothetical protein
LLSSLVKIHPVPHQNRLRRNSLPRQQKAMAFGRDVAPLGRKVGATGFARGAPQTIQVSATGLKWLEPVPSTCCVLIGTDNTPSPFLQALIRSSNSVSNREVKRAISFKTSVRISRKPDWLSVISAWQSRGTAFTPKRFQKRRRKVIFPNSTSQPSITGRSCWGDIAASTRYNFTITHG